MSIETLSNLGEILQNMSKAERENILCFYEGMLAMKRMLSKE